MSQAVKSKFTQAYRSDRVRLYEGNMMNVLASLPDEPIGVVLTDPPYVYWKHIVEQDDKELLQFDHENEWMAKVFHWTISWLPAIRRMRPGVAWFNVEPHYLGAYLRVARYLRWPMVGWWPSLQTRERCEYLVAFSDTWYPNVPQWATVWSVLVANTYGQGKSVDMLSQILRVSPEGLVLDPFCGGGSAVLAAMQVDRPVIGIEIDAAIMQTAVTRVIEMEARIHPPAVATVTTVDIVRKRECPTCGGMPHPEGDWCTATGGGYSGDAE